MIEKVLNFIEEYNLSNKTIIIGFSGGYDSMCLLDVLNKIAERVSLRLVAVHYNHNWRGEIAKQEQIHCEKFCKKNNIDFYTETAPENIKHNETVARELRYDFFERAYEKYNADAIFTAHNFDDNAETVLYRIIKGTGVVGLKGISKVRGKFFRPILDIPRAEIEEYCIKNSLSPNVDESNQDIIHNRNLIRHEILPLLEKINPEVKKSLNNLVRIATSELNIVDEYLEKLYKDVYTHNVIKTDIYSRQSFDVKRKIIYDFIYRSEIDYDSTLIENICNFIENTLLNNKPSKYSLSATKWLYVDKNRIEMISAQEKNDDIILIKQDGSYQINDAILKIETFESWFEQQSSEYTALVDLSNVKNLVLRTRRDGDVIKPLGFNGTMKLKKYLMSKNIPQHQRDKLLLLCDDNEVLWVAGVGLSDKIKTVTKSTHKLSVTYSDEVQL